MFNLVKYQVKVTFTTEMLGTAPANQELYEDHVMKRAQDYGIEPDEILSAPQTIPEIEEKGMTIFRRVNGDWDKPFIPDFMITGFLKGACGALRRSSKTKSKKISAYKKVIDTNVFVFPRMIPIVLPDGAEIDRLERTLRASTPQGDRVAIACSEMAPVGTTLAFTIEVLEGSKVTEEVLREWLDFGRYHGIGQWRSGGYGRFEYEIEAVA